MSSELLTTWTEHDAALSRTLTTASQSLRIFDQDLSRLKLERLDQADLLRRLLNARGRIEIVLRDAQALRRDHPRLMDLLTIYPHTLRIVECPPQLAQLSDSLVIANDSHALVRFSRDYARAKLIVGEPSECAPYLRRFEEIVNEGGEQISPTTLGL